MSEQDDGVVERILQEGALVSPEVGASGFYCNCGCTQLVVSLKASGVFLVCLRCNRTQEMIVVTPGEGSVP